MRILEAILEGKREGATLAALVEPEVKATPEDIAKSLPGKVNLKVQPSGAKPKGKKGSRNAPSFELRSELYRITGIDWAQVNGMDVLTAQTVFPEAGPDLNAFPTEKQFASWLGLAPTNQRRGGKILNRRTRKVKNRATTAFRNAASTLLRSQSYLGAQYRRLRTRLGAPKAITAMARKLACLFYRLIKHGQQYVDKGTEYYEARSREQQIHALVRKAHKLGVQLVIPRPA
jgi:transposase